MSHFDSLKYCLVGSAIMAVYSSKNGAAKTGSACRQTKVMAVLAQAQRLEQRRAAIA